MTNRKVIVYIAISLDGYIAKPDNDLSFLKVVEKNGEDYGYNAFINTVDVVVMGRKTYDWILSQVASFPHADKETYVITRTHRKAVGNVNFYNDDLRVLINDLKSIPGKNIFIDGGAEIVNAALRLKLVDELVISTIPILVGNGTKLFNDDRPEQMLKLLSVKQFDTGLIQSHYQVKD